MNKLFAILLILLGLLLMLVAILSLVSAFGKFEGLTSATDYGYAFGMVFFPLLVMVLGRWVYRNGRMKLKT